MLCFVFRIAVYVLPESNYCYNSKHLVGHKQMQKRHLEIMDYKFVEVSDCGFYYFFHAGVN